MQKLNHRSRIYLGLALALVATLALSAVPSASAPGRSLGGQAFGALFDKGPTDTGATSISTGGVSPDASGPFTGMTDAPTLVVVRDLPADGASATHDGVPQSADRNIEGPLPGGLLDGQIKASLLQGPSQGVQIASDQPSPFAPIVNSGFVALDIDQCCGGSASVPPDMDIAVGPSHVMGAINKSYAVYNKTGTTLAGPTQFSTFWGTTCGGVSGLSFFDPYIGYDAGSGRYVMGIDAKNAAGTQGYWCIAVSQTSDPTGAWYKYSVDANQGTTGVWMDYPHMSLWHDAIYVTGNYFTSANAFSVARVFAFNKAQMYAGTGSGFVWYNVSTNAAGNAAFTLQPVKSGSTMPASSVPAYFVETDYCNVPPCNMVTLWKLTSPFGTPAFTQIGGVTVNGYNQSVTQVQSGAGGQIKGNDFRLLDAQYSNGTIYTTDHTGCNPGTGTVDCIRWIQLGNLTGTPTALQQGLFSSNSQYRSFPDLAVDKDGNMAIGYTRMSSTEFPSVYVNGRLASDPVNTLQTEVLVRAGELSYTAFDAAPRRWGDYSGMVVDPDGCHMWYIGEYAKNLANANGKWGTYVASVSFASCTTGGTNTPTVTPSGPTPTFTPTATPVSVTNDDFNGATTIGALPYTGNATTTSYTTATDDPALCAGTPATGSHSVWFKYTPGANNTLALDSFTSGYDTVLAVFTGARGSLVRLACNDDAASGTQSQITGLAVTAGTTYYIEIAAYGSGAGGATVLHVSGTTTVTNTPTNTPTRTPSPTPVVITNTPTPTATGIACPNLGGTYCRTNNEARTWIAGSTSTGITGDDQAAAVTLPFAFNFMGTSYTSINISSNGNAHFGTSSTAYSNVAVPGTGAPNAMIAPFWDDLDPAAGGAIYTAVSGTAPNRTFTIEWRDVRAYNTGTSGITFEIQLVETSNHIWVLYQDTVFGSTTIDAGLSATSGIENSGGTAGNQYSFNSAVLSNGLTLHYWKP